VKSGLKNGKATGGKIVLSIENKNTRSSDYGLFSKIPRPGHADYPSLLKYGSVQPGSGFFSGRMTAAFVMAGAVAKKILRAQGIRTMAFSRQIGKVALKHEPSDSQILSNTYKNDVRTADLSYAPKMAREIMRARAKGDSVGGIVECRIVGVPAGIGEPMFGSIESSISSAMFAIPAVKGIEFGSGFAGAKTFGSQNNDAYLLSKGKVISKTNHAGGILGGLSSGMPICFKVAFKPTSSIGKSQMTLDLSSKKEVLLSVHGRHDPCIAIRGVPVVENVAAICMADIILESNSSKKK